jgi:hypothetical protein
MALKQFSGQYLAEADRLLLKLSTDQGDEYRLLITRRIAKLMLENHQEKSLDLVAYNTSPTASKEVLAFKQESMRQKTNWKQAFEPSKQLPLGEKPLLVSAVQYSFKQQNDKKLVSMKLTLRDNSSLSMNLPQVSLTALQLLIEQLQAQAEWALLDLAPSVPTIVATSTAPAVH